MRQLLTQDEKALVRCLRLFTIPVRGKNIAHALGTGTREIAEVAKHCREKGWWVCSGSSGYWYAKSFKEFHKSLEREEHRARSILSTIRKAKKHSTLHPVLRREA